CSRMALGSTGTESRRTCRPRRSCGGMPRRGRPLTPPADVASTWLRSAERAKTLVGGTTDQRLETEPNRVSVRIGARRRLSLTQELLVDVQRFFHTYNYAICVWPMPRVLATYLVSIIHRRKHHRGRS